MRKIGCLFDHNLYFYSLTLVSTGFMLFLRFSQFPGVSPMLETTGDNLAPALGRVSTPSVPAPRDVDGRDKPGQDEKQGRNSSFAVTACFPRTALREGGNDGLSVLRESLWFGLSSIGSSGVVRARPGGF
jgi:hypothetical protein